MKIKRILKGYPEVDFVRNFTRAVRGNNPALCRVLEVNQRL